MSIPNRGEPWKKYIRRTKMKRKILSLILVFAMTVSLLTVGTGAVEPTYGDTAGHWAESSIERWSAYGIIQGSNGQFDPNGQLTCAQLATILAKLLKLPAAKDAGFTDNTADAWYYDAINRCAAAGILNGNGDGTVTPEAPITRERAMVMLARALGIEPIRKPDLTKYTDAAQVSAYAQGMVAAMIEAGIVGGVTADELAPQANINRASTVTILDRAIGVYADKDGMTVNAKDGELVLVVAKNVKVINAPEGTEIIVVEGVNGLSVNGKSVTDNQTYVVPKANAGGSTGSSSSGGSSSGSSSGGSSSSSHSHSYATAWSYDDTYHWHASTCGHDVVSGKAEHSFVNGVCSVCGQIDSTTADAKIGSKNYKALAEAITAAKAGDTIVLLADVSNAGDIVLPADVTLNGGDHKISGASAVRVNAVGGTVRNVKFENIHNDAGKQSAICASALTGTLTVTGCTFDNVDWDAIQITPKADAAIVITNNVFKHTATDSTQQRYIHIEGTDQIPYVAVKMTITDNQFFKTAKTAERIASIAPFYVQAAAGSKLNGNYVEDRTTVIAGYGVALDEYYPMRSKADIDNDDVTAPKYVASNEDGKQYLTLAAAVEDAKATVKANKNATIKLECDVQENIELSGFTGNGDVLFNLNGKTLTGNVVVSNDAVVTKIVDYDAASKIDGTITNSGKADLNISTYGIVTGEIKKTSDGKIIIDKGIFSEKPDGGFIKSGYFAMNVDGKWRVGEKSDEGAAAMGFAVRVGKDSKAKYYKTFADAVNANELSLVLLKNQSGVNATTTYNNAYGNFTVTLNNHSFEGALASTYIGVSIGGSGQATFSKLTVPTGKPFIVYNKADVTLNDAEVSGGIKVGTTATDTAKLTITGGTYTGAITVGNEASLVITGGTFSSDPSAYVADGYFVKSEDGKHTVIEAVAKIGGTNYSSLAEAIKAAASGETVTLLKDASGAGLSSADGTQVRESLTVDFGGHTYTMENPAVGSKGTETQAMHWGTSLGSVTLKNGKFQVAANATQVAMAMQNYIDFTAEGMTLDFTNVPVVHYGKNEFTGANAIYNDKEVPMFNNNYDSVKAPKAQMTLKDCMVILPATSNFGGNISGTLKLDNTNFNGYLAFSDTDGTIIVSNGSTIKGDCVKDYFGNTLIITNDNGKWTATAKASEP